MKQIKYGILSFFLELCIIVSLFPAISLRASAATTELDSGSCGTDLTWTMYSTGELVITGSGALTRYVVSGWYSYQDTITTLYLPEGLTSICDKAFINCTNLSGQVTIPNNVTYIGERAFYNCSSIESLVLGSSVKTIGAYAFYGCSSLTGDLAIPDSAMSIGNYAFTGTSFDGELTIGNSVTTIGQQAFSGCGFTGELIIPKSVTSIGDGAFSSCWKFSGDLIIPDSVTSIGASAFTQFASSGNYNSSSRLVIGSGLTTINDDVFWGCSFNEIYISSSITNIGKSSFSMSGIDAINVYFYGNAPELEATTSGHDSFSFVDGVTIYYIKTMTGWTTPTWYGYSVAEWDPTHLPTLTLNKTSLDLSVQWSCL